MSFRSVSGTLYSALITLESSLSLCMSRFRLLLKFFTNGASTAHVYLTGRTENMRQMTLNELREFGFPTIGVELVMFSFDDFARTRGVDNSGPTLVDVKARLLSVISGVRDVVRAVDDYPGYFPVYKQFNIPDRIGLLRSRRYTPQDYIDRGATRVIQNWKVLEDDLPKH